jgi:hypothetical protein
MVEETATGLLSLAGLDILPRSTAVVAGTEVGLATTGTGPQLAILVPIASPVIAGFEGESSRCADRTLLLGPSNAANLDALSALLAWLRLQTLGLRPSVGFGDRLGVATPAT